MAGLLPSSCLPACQLNCRASTALLGRSAQLLGRERQPAASFRGLLLGGNVVAGTAVHLPRVSGNRHIRSRVPTSSRGSITPSKSNWQGLCCKAAPDAGNLTTAVTVEGMDSNAAVSDEELERERLKLDQLAREQMAARAAAEEALANEDTTKTRGTLAADVEVDGGPVTAVGATEGGDISGVPGGAPSEGVESVPPGAWKWAIRKRVWDALEKKGLAAAPQPVHHRIPNFVGSVEAAEQVASLPEFANASMVKVNPDSPQKYLRFLTLAGGKTMITPQPRLRTGFFSLLDPSQLAAEDLASATTPRGAAKLSAPIGLFDNLKVDLIVVGSVAVDSKTGARLGKGEGFAELEYGMLRWMGAIDDSTPVVTSVNDEQLVDDIEVEKLLVHDLPVDIICTPTRIIRVENSPIPKPTGIYWDKLSPQKLQSISILRELKAHIEKETGEALPTGPSEQLPPSARRKKTKTAREKVTGGETTSPAAKDETPAVSGAAAVPSSPAKRNGGRKTASHEKWMKYPYTVFVRNLDQGTKWEELATLVEDSAGVKPLMVDVFRVKDQDRAMARVALPVGTDVAAVIGSVDGAELGGRRIIVQVDESSPRQQKQRKDARRAMDYPTRVFVKGLNKGTKKSQLAAVLQQKGVEYEVIELLLLDGRPRGLARIALPEGADVGEVVKALDGTEVDDRILRVQADQPGPKVDYSTLRAQLKEASQPEAAE